MHMKAAERIAWYQAKLYTQLSRKSKHRRPSAYIAYIRAYIMYIYIRVRVRSGLMVSLGVMGRGYY